MNTTFMTYRDECEKLREEVERLTAANAAQSAALEKAKVALSGLHHVCEIALEGKDGQQHVYFETRAGLFVEATTAMQQAEEALAAIEAAMNGEQP